MGSIFRAVPRNVLVGIAIVVPLLLLAGGGYAALHRSPGHGSPQALTPSASPSDAVSSVPSDVPTPDASLSPMVDVSPTPATTPEPTPSATARAASATPAVTHAPTAAPTAVQAAKPSPSPPPPDCSSANTTNSITTDHPTYASGSPVYVTVKLTNHSATDCGYYPVTGNPNICIDQGSTEVWYSTQSCNALPNTGGPVPPTVLKHGASAVVVITWNQKQKPGTGDAPRGTYTIKGGWSETDPVTSAAFTLN